MAKRPKWPTPMINPAGMRRLQLPGLPLAAAQLVLGTALFGSSISRDLAFALLDRYFAAGGNFIDTAHVYAVWLPNGLGASERTTGAWLRARGLRDQILLGTKGAHPDMTALGDARVTPAAIAQDLTESLERLETNYIDLYWLHRDDPQVPVDELLDALNREIAAGRIRAFGCSNWTLARQQAAADYAQKHELRGFCASQVGWSLARRNPGTTFPGCLDMDEPMHDWHRAHELAAFAYTPQAIGFFSGKYSAEIPVQNGRGRQVQAGYFNAENFRRLAIAQDLARKHGATANQIALAWLLHQPFPVFPILGPGRLDQLEDSLGAAKIRMTPSETNHLNGERSEI
jgi:aryl-alcohol dehydrogenase-like predicted oxidoreductase